MLAVGVVLGIEVVEGRDGAQDGHLALGPEGNHASGHHQHAPSQGAPELVVQVTDAGNIDKVGHRITYALQPHAPGPRGGCP